jgi:hypothetical protein
MCILYSFAPFSYIISSHTAECAYIFFSHFELFFIQTCFSSFAAIDRTLSMDDDGAPTNGHESPRISKPKQDYVQEVGRAKSHGFQPIEKPPSGRLVKQPSRDSDQSDQLTGSDYY